MEHNDLITADTGGQALGFLLHCTVCTEEHQRKSIHTFTHLFSHSKRIR